MIGTGLSLTQLATRQYLGYSPGSLFSSGEQGVWYDPSDMSTMFQDAAGTTPVTAMEQPVGLILDKSKGLVLGPELAAQTNTPSAWSSMSATPVVLEGGQIKVTFGGASFAAYSFLRSPNLSQNLKIGGLYRVSGKARVSPGGSVNIAVYSGGIFGGGSAIITSTELVSFSYFIVPQSNDIYLMATDVGQGETIWLADISVRELPGNHAYQTTAASRPVLSAQVNQYTSTETLATQNVTTAAATYTLRFEGAGTITLSGTKTDVYSAGTHTLTGVTAGTLTSTVLGTVSKADLRVANDGVNLPAYQRVNTSTDYDTAGFLMYLRFDGVDDSMVTNSINFTSTDKMTVFAGVRKLSNSTMAIVEFSADTNTSNSSFGLFCEGSPGAANNYFLVSKGTTIIPIAAATFVAPITNAVTGLCDISGDSAILRVNGAQVAQSTADQGTGNYGNYSLFIGRRGGTRFPLNGRLYSLIIRGAQSSTEQIIATEKYVQQKTPI